MKLNLGVRRRERGGVLILVALSVAMIGLLVSFTVDVMNLLGGREEVQHHLRFAALSGVEEYFTISCNEGELAASCHERKLQEALTAVNADLDEWTNGTRFELEADTDLQPSTAANVRVIPGRWLTQESGDDTCPSGKTAPCFKPVDLDYPFASAVQIITKDNFGIDTFFSGAFFGREVVHLDTGATAAAVPRRGCFVVDISSSVAYLTHLPSHEAQDWDHNTSTPTTNVNDDVSDELPAHYAFALAGDNLDNPSVSTNKARYEDWWDIMCAPGADNSVRGEGVHPNTHHFCDDYVKMTRLINDDYRNYTDKYSPYHPDPDQNSRYSAGEERFRYRIDKSTDPEPFATIVQALNQAFQSYRQRSVAGDKACLILYDRKLTWPRVVRLTDDFDYLVSLTDFGNKEALTDDPDLNLDIAALNNASGRELSIRHGIFPDYLPWQSIYSNMVLGLQEAMSQIAFDQAAEMGVSSSYFVVHFGDGLVNCKDEDDGSGITCINNYDTHLEGLADIDAIAVQAELESIPLHFIQFGDYVQPHTVDLATPESTEASPKCYTDAQARALGHGWRFTKGCTDEFNNPCSQADIEDSFYAASSDTPYMQINNDLYQIAQKAKGLWAPIRPVPNNCTVNECDPYTNGGLRTTDPLCRTPLQQMEDYLAEIVGQNPFTIVDLGSD